MDPAKKINILRINSSSYMDNVFIQQERELFSVDNKFTYFQDVSDIDNNDPVILISNSQTNFDLIPPIIFEKTILLIHPNSGYDNLPKSLNDYQFPIILGNSIRSQAVVEYTLSCIFHQFTKIENFYYWPNDRKWDRKLIRDQQIMIIGQGSIGTSLANTLKYLSRNVKIYDPYITNRNLKGVEYLDAFEDSVLAKTDILILASELNEFNQDIINHKFLAKLKQSCLIINSARGKLISEIDLNDFLEKNTFAFAYLDVFYNEPFSSADLKSIKNINRTPHIAGVYDSLNQDILNFEKIMINDFYDYYPNEIEKFKLDYQQFLLNLKNKPRPINFYDKQDK